MTFFWSSLHFGQEIGLFFWSSLHFEQEIGHLGSDGPFFGLHFIALHCGGQIFGQPRGGVKFAKSFLPPISKNGRKWSILQNHPPNAQHKFAPPIQGSEKADILAKSGSALNCLGPEPFILIPYASCLVAIRDWSVKRRKRSWIERKKQCSRTKENVERWASPQLTERLLRLKRHRLNETLQVLTGHCNLQKHWSTMGHDVSSACPKCNLEEEIPNHLVGECTYFHALRKKAFGKEKSR